MERTHVKATWQGENAFLAENDAGGKAELGGDGIRPMQMVLAALAGCSGVDIVLILKKKM